MLVISTRFAMGVFFVIRVISLSIGVNDWATTNQYALSE